MMTVNNQVIISLRCGFEDRSLGISSAGSVCLLSSGTGLDRA